MRPDSSKKKGFTVVELMVSLAVAAILMSMAIPAFNEFIQQRTMAARGNDFVLAVTYARSEAIRRGGIVSVQSGAGGGDWGSEGYCVVVGTPGNCNGDVLRSFDPMNDATLVGTGGFAGVATLSFNGRGMLNLGAAGAVELCSTNPDVNPGRIVNVTLVGSPDANELECS
ncbi:MAG: GspH/FimT family pseudopilin [Pseudomonadales bacterium]